MLLFLDGGIVEAEMCQLAKIPITPATDNDKI